ncbi:MAG: cytochrome c biogenesis protein [ANME-2 cluster archaeon]|nr:cytochrome c biogenesis protein [ANME-2 cluster archaeon]
MKNKDYKKYLYAATAILMVAAIIIIFFYSPVPVKLSRGIIESDADWMNRNYSFHISYFHIPIALTAYLSFFFVLIYSIQYLRDPKQIWDIKAVASAEVGVIFAGLTLITGSIWAGAAWEHYWPPGDIRLNTSLVLFLIYLAYLSVRSAIDVPDKRARLSAVFGIIGFITVPISFYSIRIWSSTHPKVVDGGGFHGNAIILPILLNMVAFVLLCISLITFKVDNLNLQEDLIAAKNEKGV